MGDLSQYNFDAQVEAQERIFPAGRWNFRIADAGILETRNGPAVRIRYVSDRHGDLTQFYSLSRTKSRSDLARVFIAAGRPDGTDTSDLIGCIIDGLVVHNEVNGKIYANLVDVRRSTGAPF